MEEERTLISVYTDGSCNPGFRIGGWAAIILHEHKKILLSGSEVTTSHQQMELMAAIKAIQSIESSNMSQHPVCIYTDSQYLVNLQQRRHKLVTTGLSTRRHEPVRNAAEVSSLIQYLDTWQLTFVKVQAHMKSTDQWNYNREADKISRKIIRDYVKKIATKSAFKPG